jgi:gluconate 2-dehydrogenase gamma chain
MARKWNPKRRRFLEAAAAGGLSAPVISCSGEKNPWRCLKVAEADTAAAFCDELIPPDVFAGAASAGAVEYIDRQLSGHLRQHRQAYRSGLAGVEQASMAKHGKKFSALTPEQRIDLMKLIEKGGAEAESWKAADQREFFRLILAHTMQSYYGDPRHGGNRDEAGYRSIGVPATLVRGRSQHDIQQGTAKPEKIL